MVGIGLHPMMSFGMFLCPLQEMWGVMFCKNKLTFFSFQFSRRQLDIILSIGGIHIVVNVVIVEPTWIDLVSQTTFSHGVVRTLTSQVKERFYKDHYPTYVFFLLAIEVFGYLHQLVDKFLHRCVNMAWTTKGTRSIINYVVFLS